MVTTVPVGTLLKVGAVFPCHVESSQLSVSTVPSANTVTVMTLRGDDLVAPVLKAMLDSCGIPEKVAWGTLSAAAKVLANRLQMMAP